jgi:hypothetical protein
MVIHYSGTPLQDRFCGNRDKGVRVYCHPKYYEPLPATLYHNLGNGTFEDVSKKSQIANYAGRGMSVAFADYDADGLLDAFVTNDNMPNFLFHNLGGGRFEEVGLVAGVALPDRGKPVSSMGADFRDYDNDGRPDISVTALAGETFPLFRNTGNGIFTDATYMSRMGALSTAHSGWGNGFIDLNNDGWKDLFTANSHVDRVDEIASQPYRQPNSVFINEAGKFADGTSEALRAAAEAHRGAAFGDLNADGTIDVVVSALEAPAEIWQNTTPKSGNWIAFRLKGSTSNRDGIGARIRLGKQWNEMTSSLGYASSSLGPVHFGLGAATTADDVEIRWPSGRVQRLKAPAVNRVIEVTEPPH